MTRLSLFLDPQEGMTYETLRTATLCAEQCGFFGMYRSDHLTSTAHRFERAATEAWSTLAGLARETTRLRLGTLVTPIGFRHPSLYAKMINTIDEMSGGRVDVSIGTGWYRPEHDLLGLPFGDLNERYSQLREYLAVMFKLWGVGTSSPSGNTYGVGDIVISPQSIQRPHPRVIVGGHGAKRTPALAARYGDEHNVDWLSPEATEACFKASAAACEAIGRDPSTLGRSILTGAIVAEEQAAVAGTFANAMKFLGIEDAEQWRQRTKDAWFVGTTDGLIDRLGAFVGAGTQHVVLMLAPGDDMEIVSLVGKRVLTALSTW